MTESSKNRKRVAGGAATGGGINFQAAVSAIACVYMIRGIQASWLEKIADDVPVAIDAETGGAGDDIRLLVKSGKIVEAQVKKGLRSGSKLWDSLISMATAVKARKIDYGLLIVSPTSSNTITEQLANDIIRLGDGRSDNISKIGTQLVEKLTEKGLSVLDSCKCIRIKTINAITGNQADILAAKSELKNLCSDQDQVVAAWNSLYKDSLYLIEHRGRRDVSSALSVLNTDGVRLEKNNSTAPMLLLKKLTNWTFITHSYFSIFGINKKLRVDEALIPLRAVVQDEIQIKNESIAEALKKYQTWDSRSVDRNAVVVDPETLARFVTRTILIGGPGMGKTTLLKKIARRYSEDNIPILNVRLISVASRIRAGNSFEEAVFDLGLDGSNLSPKAVKQAAFPNWLLLCDGLDECGKLQEDVAAGIARFSTGYPNCRVIVTTRPIGYDTAHFSDWRHYCLEPLESSSAPAYLMTLLSESVTEGITLQYNINKLCSAELKREETSKVISRSPLLLGLAASIIVRGGHLSTTKERLFEQIFELIDEVPNSRIPEPPAPAAFLKCFLNILGWQITAQPLSRIEDMLNRCAEEIAYETGSRLLKARADSEAYLQYWIDVGMIERLGHGYEETLVFIHKSFGEFAAARHLKSMGVEKQQAAIASIVDSQDWSEVIRFAAILGLSNIIADILIAKKVPDVRNIALATELMAVPEQPIETTLRGKIISEAIKIISSERRLQAFEVGEPFVDAARRFPKEIGPIAGEFINHKQSWTCLIGWAAAVAAGSEYYPLDSLYDSMRICIENARPMLRRSLSGGIILGKNGERDLLQTFILDGTFVLLEQSPSENTDKIVFDILNSRNLATMGFLRKAKKILQSKNKIELAEKIDEKYYKGMSIPDFEGYAKAQLIVYNSIFEALKVPDKIIGDGNHPGMLLHLSAFFTASRYNELPASDTWVWTKPFDKEAIQEVLEGFIGVSGLDPEKIRNEAQMARGYLLKTDTDKNWTRSLYDITTEVDPPEINWDIATSLNLDISKIEASLYHPSEWIVWIAGSLIESILSLPELKLTIQRLLKNGKKNTLWAACGLIGELEQDQAIGLIYERLSSPLVHGCEYLYKILQKLDLKLEPELVSILSKGLKANVKIAEEAAVVISSIVRPGRFELANIIEESLKYWSEHEEPYPTKGGVVPNSPRAKLIEALMKIQPPSYAELKSYLADSRSDVKEVASKKLIDCLRFSDGPRIQFLNDICERELSPNYLRAALESMVPLSPLELELWENLLINKNPKIRFNAMVLLENGFMDSSFVQSHAEALTKDEEQQIQDRAYRILDKNINRLLL
ncbi:NACHT domain-containing protein [uncultured Desulfobacter sp.]|uniref:NACHT domain-containing protein n=1 Tax=uncultured Desulfobacter sp. TaxID=240139 RepID=UPI0029F54E6A|nr:NACHT domain-containing protein [uncultured Desulfobacter sp.]